MRKTYWHKFIGAVLVASSLLLLPTSEEAATHFSGGVLALDSLAAGATFPSPAILIDRVSLIRLRFTNKLDANNAGVYTDTLATADVRFSPDSINWTRAIEFKALIPISGTLIDYTGAVGIECTANKWAVNPITGTAKVLMATIYPIISSSFSIPSVMTMRFMQVRLTNITRFRNGAVTGSAAMLSPALFVETLTDY